MCVFGNNLSSTFKSYIQFRKFSEKKKNAFIIPDNLITTDVGSKHMERRQYFDEIRFFKLSWVKSMED